MTVILIVVTVILKVELNSTNNSTWRGTVMSIFNDHLLIFSINLSLKSRHYYLGRPLRLVFSSVVACKKSQLIF